MLFQGLKSFWRYGRAALILLINRKFIGMLGLCVALLMTSCSLPQVSAESRLFLNLSLSLLGDYNLSQAEFEGTTVGGISALSYDRQRDRIYALADDDTQPRFYTLNLDREETSPTFAKVTVEAVTQLNDHTQPESTGANLDGEGIEITHRGSVFVASEGNLATKIPPRLSEFQFSSGNWQGDLPLPKDYWSFDENGTFALGVQPNQGLESLAINLEGDRLFAATETPLVQDLPQAGSEETPYYSRFLHYWIGEPEPLLISENLYPLDAPNADMTRYGLSDLIPVDNAGHFLSLERSYSPVTGHSAKIYQMATGGATDISRSTLSPNANSVVPIMKKLLLNLNDLDISLQNLEGIILGPYLEDGSRSVILVSDNDFQPDTPTQFLLLRLEQKPQAITKSA
jgi:hypothetical protein